MDDTPFSQPSPLPLILRDAAELDFTRSCEARTGSLLATLAASKPGGRILELGTGVGAGTAWLLHGMSPGTCLLSVDADAQVQAVAARHLGQDRNVTFEIADADAWLDTYTGPRFSLVYVDCRPGKFRRLHDVVRLLEPGGIYVGDDLLPQATWPPDHQGRVNAFLAALPSQTELLATPMRWASGLVVASRI